MDRKRRAAPSRPHKASFRALAASGIVHQQPRCVRSQGLVAELRHRRTLLVGHGRRGASRRLASPMRSDNTPWGRTPPRTHPSPDGGRFRDSPTRWDRPRDPPAPDQVARRARLPPRDVTMLVPPRESATLTHSTCVRRRRSWSHEVGPTSKPRTGLL